MVTSKRETFSLLFIIKKAKLLKNGEAPICMRITVNGRVAEVLIKRSIPIELWNQAKECSKSKNSVGRELNHYLETIKARIMQIHREMVMDDEIITAATIRDRYNGKDKVHRTIVEVYSEHNEKCKALIGIDFTQSTVEKFYTSLSHLKEYMRSKYSRDDIFLKEIDTAYITDFEFYLKSVRGCQHNSAIKHLKNLKKVVRIALANSWIKHDPFLGIQFKHTKTETQFLTSEELSTLINKEFTIERLAQVRDVFYFCTLTGLAFIDVKQLKSEHITTDNSGALWIRKPRQKTGVMCNIPLLSPAIALIEKYKNHPECIKNRVLLPVLSNQRTNGYLKEIADICGIKKRLSTHVSRHTAATTTFLANGVSIENVAKILGHSNTKMTQHYAKVLDSSIMRDMVNVEKQITKSTNL
ncbi:MAG: site-specific integrase [Rikenellaceae bacterium]